MFAVTVTALLSGCGQGGKEPLVWSSTNQIATVKQGEITALFTFKVKNRSRTNVVISDVKASCGCTIAQLPGRPWQLAPGERSQMQVLVDLRGKTGELTKDIAIFTANSTNVLMVTVKMPEGFTNGMTGTMADRMFGQQLAATDRQAVFKTDCVKCHLEPAFGRQGEQLYHVACGICHEAKHRATMVPDLKTLKTEVDAGYWTNMVAHGKPGTLMPGFAAREGGPLDDEQITGLVAFLEKAFPRPVKPAANPATKQ